MALFDRKRRLQPFAFRTPGFNPEEDIQEPQINPMALNLPPEMPEVREDLAQPMQPEKKPGKLLEFLKAFAPGGVRPSETSIGKVTVPLATGAMAGAMGGVPIAAGMLGGLTVKNWREDVGRAEAADQQRKQEMERLKALEPPSDIKSFQAYQGMTPEEQSSFREMKAASGLAMQPFRAEEMALTRKASEERAQEARQAKQELDTNKSIERLSNKVGNIPDVFNSVKEYEKLAGFDLEDYDPDTNTANGEPVDLPGVNVPGLGRISAYSSKAKQLDAALQKAYNVTLKERSGAAVVNAEFDRFQKEFSEGKLNTEAEKLFALKRFKNALKMEWTNREAGFKPEDVETYGQRGGVTTGLSAKDREAINWARQNPSSPEAQQILQHHGMD